jgi:hypothetical protein
MNTASTSKIPATSQSFPAPPITSRPTLSEALGPAPQTTIAPKSYASAVEEASSSPNPKSNRVRPTVPFTHQTVTRQHPNRNRNPNRQSRPDLIHQKPLRLDRLDQNHHGRNENSEDNVSSAQTVAKNLAEAETGKVCHRGLAIVIGIAEITRNNASDNFVFAGILMEAATNSVMARRSHER